MEIKWDRQESDDLKAKELSNAEQFFRNMLIKLLKNQDKTGWSDTTFEFLMNRLEANWKQFESGMKSSIHIALEENVDDFLDEMMDALEYIGNYAMMLESNLARVKSS